MSKGISENKAVKNAIESFEQGNILRRRIATSVINYRNNSTVFTGIVLLLLTLYIGFWSGPVPNDPREVLSFLFNYLLFSILFFLPVGYFLPVIFLKGKKLRLVVSVTIPLGSLYGLYLSIITIGYLPIRVSISIFFASLFGSMIGGILGYEILTIINKVSLIFKNRIHKIK